MYKILQHFPPFNSISFELFDFIYIALIDYQHLSNDISLKFLFISVLIYLLVVKGAFFRWGHKNRNPFYSRCPSLLKGPCCRAEAKDLQLFIDNGDVSLWAKYSRKGRLTSQLNKKRNKKQTQHPSLLLAITVLAITTSLCKLLVKLCDYNFGSEYSILF